MPLATGTRLGPYEIVALVGAGGMGEVYRAHDTRLDRPVAIKTLKDTGLDAPDHRRLERFRQEARAVARITHPNICTLYDVCEEGSTTFLVMEFVEGTTLERRLEDGPLPLATALKIATQIADALDHAHRQGVVHRDLKPGNVMLARDRATLLDFGLAKLKEPDDGLATLTATMAAPLTEARTIVGTVPYMAPEQIEGRQADARTDIFALGIVLYEMVAGRRPFTGDSSAAVMAGIVGAEPPSLSSLQPLTPLPLERLVGRCLAKDPDDRWQTARDLAAELRWIAEAGSATGFAAAPPKETQPRSRRSLLPVGVGGAIAGAAAVGLVAFVLRSPPPSVASYTKVTFRRGAVTAARFAPDGNIVYSASWDGQPYEVFLAREGSADARPLGLENGRILSISPASEMAVLFGRQNIATMFGQRVLASVPVAGGARRDLLEGVVDADWIPNTNDLAVVRVHDDGRAHVEFPIGTSVHESAAAWSLRVSPDGQRVAFFEGPVVFGGPNAMLTVVDRSGTTTTLSRDWFGLGLAWAPSGKEIWFTATHGAQAPWLHAVSLSGAERSIEAAPDWLVLYDISREGRVLLTRNTIRIAIACQLPGEPVERDLTWLGGSQVSDLSPDGRTLIFAEILLGSSASGVPKIFRRSTAGTPAIDLGDGDADAMSPDGKWMLTRSEGSWKLLPIGAGSARTLAKSALARMQSGGWLPDGKQIVFTGWESGPTARPRIYVQAVDGGAPRPITPDGVLAAQRAASPDGTLVLGRAGNTWQLYPIAGGEPRPIQGLTGADAPLQWSSDGAAVYAMANQGRNSGTSRDVIRVELATGRRSVWKTLAPTDPVGIDNVGPIAITPDARAYCYTHMRRLGELFTVDGLK